MKLSFRARFFAAASMTVAAGLIGCQLNRGHSHHDTIDRSELIRSAEPLPLNQQQLPRTNDQTPILVPQAKVPPSDNEDPVPSAGLSPIQRTCFSSSCNSCTTSCSPCPTSCDPCRPTFFDHMRAKMARSQCRMNYARSRFHDLLTGLCPSSGSCSPCSPCSPCMSPCGGCETVMDGFVIDDGMASNNMWMPGSGCSPCSSNGGMWMPAGYPNMAYQQPMAQYQPQMQMPQGQPPCNCRQNNNHYQQPTYAPQYPQPQQPYYQSQPQPSYAPQQPYPQPQYAPPQYAQPQPASPQYQPQYPAQVVPQRDTVPPQNYSPPMPVVPQAPGTN